MAPKRDKASSYLFRSCDTVFRINRFTNSLSLKMFPFLLWRNISGLTCKKQKRFVRNGLGIKGRIAFQCRSLHFWATKRLMLKFSSHTENGLHMGTYVFQSNLLPPQIDSRSDIVFCYFLFKCPLLFVLCPTSSCAQNEGPSAITNLLTTETIGETHFSDNPSMTCDVAVQMKESLRVKVG